MDFDLTPEQEMLRDTVRDVLERAYTPERRTEIVATELGWDPQIWRTFAEIGLLGLTFAEEDGGMGAGPIEAMLVLTELGRRLAPEPLLDCALLPGGLIARAGTDTQRKDLLPRIAEGDLRPVFAHGEPGVRWPATELTTRAVRTATGWNLTGAKHPVSHGDSADLLIVSAALPVGSFQEAGTEPAAAYPDLLEEAGPGHPGGVAAGLFLVDPAAAGVRRTDYLGHDGVRGATIEFDGVAAELLGEPKDAAEIVTAAVAGAQAALCAEAIGAMEESLRLTTEYLKTRKQFGVPLRAFQTLTQRAADMYVSLELARGMSMYASMSLADGVADPVVASRAKLRIGRSARHIGQEAIQMHGGIGMTAEYPVGHYTARLTAIEHSLGDSSDHLRYLGRTVGDHQMVEI
ncbi:acyl-CoA dehydrogenase family protein [Nocardia sp. 2]|uniref:Acyl-CoA dehydrogenase family protein n=1 Tax=Nocardia acididurans TaxID=2802282 RepID=A0ABS1M1V9_9NOCA|nr:acyl-CoA dehydrogenase family protein [Nocardia acididurans]MBL1074647.1 acyl-CoA dehydrogenase family protein [Nocardia acididurans]